MRHARAIRPMMGTWVKIVAPTASPADFASAFAHMEAAAAQLSEFNPNGALSRVNREAARCWVPCPPLLFKVLRHALEVAEATERAFDCTWAPLKELWETDGLPSALRIRRARANVGSHLVVLDGARRRVRLAHPAASIGLGGCAKGFVAEAGVELLQRRGVRDALVDAGGDVVARGTHGDRPWRVGVRHPRHASAVLAIVELRDEAIATSGDYESFRLRRGRRYHHLLDPRTGRPARSCQSTSVIAKNAGLADALSTAMFVLGAQGAARALRAFPGTTGLVVDARGRRHEVSAS